MPAFSVIVPVFNSEKTLRRCLDSLLHQQYADFEVLMIENGSTDQSNAICREYAADDGRFVLHTLSQNRGPSVARNTGLENAQGQWIAFVDSDDYVTPDYLQQLRSAFLANNADAVFFGYRNMTTEGTEIALCIPRVSDVASYYDILTDLARQNMFGYTWIKAFRTDAIGWSRFHENLNLMEDEVFACEVLSRERRITVLQKPIYFYVTGNFGSLMGRTHQDYCEKLDAAYCAWKTLLCGRPNSETFLQEKANACVSQCMYYGFERDVNVKLFFFNLANSVFFQDATLNNAFCSAISSKNSRQLSCMRTIYRLRIKATNFLKTIRGIHK